ncbi:Glu/Leu/Phe/Val dehydrogenase dimerization domain-containing protein [Saccharopolyspora sp. NPDC003752]
MSHVIEFQDPVRGVPGFLVYDGTEQPLAAGGCRVQPGVDADQLRTLAGRMTLKQRVLGINVAGAKCGLDLDPASEHKAEVLSRFFAFLGEELRSRYSMGADMGTGWQELNRHAAGIGLPSIKYAIRNAQLLSDEDFHARMAVLETRVGSFSVAERRAGHALGHAAIGAAHTIGVGEPIRVAMQGFGNLGRAAACAWFEEGVRLVAAGDEHGTITSAGGLDIAAMVDHPLRTPVPDMGVGGQRVPRGELFKVPADVLVLAGGADALSVDQAAAVQVGAVVVGANCGLSEQAEAALNDRGVVTIPDFVGGIGGSASMEALFGPRRPPTPEQVLGNLACLMRDLVDDITDEAGRTGASPRQAALRRAAESVVAADSTPYGSCPYLTATSS